MVVYQHTHINIKIIPCYPYTHTHIYKQKTFEQDFSRATDLLVLNRISVLVQHVDPAREQLSAGWCLTQLAADGINPADHHQHLLVGDII